MTTSQFAAAIGLQTQSLIVSLSRNGSYFGIVPIKLPNGRLFWPADSVERLMVKGSAK